MTQADPGQPPVPAQAVEPDLPEPTMEEALRERFPDGPPPPPGTSSIVFFKDNLEAFAIAIVMALVIKHFCVEAFKIPTGSMEPTLLGENHSVETDGDRILVDKFAYLLSEPSRWDIPVFRYPLDRSRNFIKRIAGLGGERLRIHRGDIWVKPAADPDAAYRIARKNRRVRDALYFRVYPPPPEDREDLDAEAVWKREGPEGAWALEDHGRYAFVGGSRASLVLADNIHKSSTAGDWPRHGNYGEYARDVRLQATLRRGTGRAATGNDETAPTQVTLSWSPDGEWRVALTIAAAAGGSKAVLERKGQPWKPPVPIDAVLSSTRDLQVELELVDGDLRVWIDGDEVAVVADERRIEESLPSGRHQELRIDAEGGPLVVEDLAIDRDLYYIDSFSHRPEWKQEGVVIPKGAYFMLGDNTESSSDSRKWRVRTVHLTDGRTIQYDDSESPNYMSGDTTRKYVIDVDGIRREWSEDEEDYDRGSSARNAPFVWRELIVGRAFVIFWPLTPNPPGRLKFIH